MSRELTDILRRASKLAPYETLEELLMDPDGFGLRTASPVQRAICRMADGRDLGDLWDDADVRSAFGIQSPTILQDPVEIVVVTGIRSGKSLLAAAACVHMTQTCPMENEAGVPLGAGDLVRVSIQSTSTETGQAVFKHVVENVMRSSFLRSLVVGDPKSDYIVLRHPTGKHIDIKVVAGARAGATLVARWSAGVVFDEAARMQGQEDGVVNLEDSRAAVRHRLLRNAKLWYITSKWRPSGFIHRVETEEHGKPSKRIVVSCPADLMNPVGWTKEIVARHYAEDPEGARVELGNQYEDPEASLYPLPVLERYRRDSPVILPREEALTYVAAIDPATRGNAWTFVIMTKKDSVIRLVYAWQWQGSSSEPLDPMVVLAQIRDVCREYGIDYALTDQLAPDFIIACARSVGFGLFPEDFRGEERTRLYLSFARRLEAGIIELGPKDLAFNDAAIRDLSMVRRRSRRNGGIEIVLPRTSDGRHVDFVPPIVAASAQYMDEAVVESSKPLDDAEEDRLIEESEAEPPGDEDDIQESWYDY